MFNIFFALLFSVPVWSGGGAFLEDGMEYVYDGDMYQNTGTMDYAPSAAALAWKFKMRMQVEGDNIHVMTSDVSTSQYVGPWSTSSWAWHRTSFTSTSNRPEIFTITYKQGKAVSLKVPRGFDIHARNMARAFAATWQLNLEDKPYFTSTESTLHGGCRVQYVVNDNVVSKSVSHFKDCQDRKFRVVDDYRGFRCDGDWSLQAWELGDKFVEGQSGAEPLYSTTNTVFIVLGKGEKYQVQRMVMSGTVAAQFHETSGVSSFINVNRSLTLLNAKSSDGSIRPSNSAVEITDLTYETDDDKYQWNSNRNLKEAEPFWSFGSYETADQPALQHQLLHVLASMRENLNLNERPNKESINNLHKFGAKSMNNILVNMDYDNIIATYNKLKSKATDDEGKAALNTFREYLVETGTSASAMAIKDLVVTGVFENESDAARAITGVAFHIRRPTAALVTEFAEVLESERLGLVEMAGPLALAHLIERTCTLAGYWSSRPRKDCLTKLSDVWAQKYMDKFRSATNIEEQLRVISFLANLKSTKAMELMKPVAYGDQDNLPCSVQVKAIKASFWGTVYKQNTKNFFLPIFMNIRNCHPARIAALDQIFVLNGDVDVTTLSTIMTQMFAEPDNEVLNYVHTLFDKYAHSRYGCNEGQRTEKVKYFLKYMNQIGLHKSDYGFGISKTYRQSFTTEKYGYGGGLEFWVIGSHDSTVPLEVSMRIDNNIFGGYQSNLLTVNLRLQGLSKALVNRFLDLPHDEFRIQELADVFRSMGIALKERKPVEVEIQVMLKDVIILHKLFEAKDAEANGEFRNYLSSLQRQTGNEFNVIWQRVLKWGSYTYEQPTESGLPMLYYTSTQTLGSMKAVMKRGLSRGVLFRDLDFNLHVATQGFDCILFQNPLNKVQYLLAQDRVHNSQLPVHLLLGMDVVKRELRIRWLRDNSGPPFMIVMHSRTSVGVRKPSLAGEIDISSNCPDCKSFVFISKGEEQKKSRVMIDNDDKYTGSWTQAEIMDCEMEEIEEARTVTHVVNAFLPLNKYPPSVVNIIISGLRQARSFLLYFPRAETCGAYYRSGPSSEHPLKEVDISLQAKQTEDSKKKSILGQSDKKLMIKVDIKALGETRAENRNIKVNVKYERSVMGIENSLKVQFSSAGNRFLDLPDYVVCASFDNKYSPIASSPFHADLTERLGVRGKASFRYGEGKKCASVPGSAEIRFDHSTTDRAREELKSKPSYVKCLEQRKSSEWKGSQDPWTAECWQTAWDTGLARKYTWTINFLKTTPTVKSWLSKAQTGIKATLLPYYDVDSGALDISLSDSQKIDFEAEYKNNDKTVDITFVTEKGTSKFLDVGLSSKPELRQLRMESTIPSLLSNNILQMCKQTSVQVSTLDNVTFPYSPQSCWSLVSGNCDPEPGYAVFTKKTNGLLAMRAYIGGHKVEFLPTSGSNVKITKDGAAVTVNDKGATSFKEKKEVIFTLVRWGEMYTIFSPYNALINYDPSMVQVLPAPYMKGQHCGVCGNYDGNKINELFNKAEIPVTADSVASSWCI